MLDLHFIFFSEQKLYANKCVLKNLEINEFEIIFFS